MPTPHKAQALGPQPAGMPRHTGKTAPAGKYWCGNCKAYRVFKNFRVRVNDASGLKQKVANCSTCNKVHAFRLKG